MVLPDSDLGPKFAAEVVCERGVALPGVVECPGAHVALGLMESDESAWTGGLDARKLLGEGADGINWGGCIMVCKGHRQEEQVGGHF
jgi:hypothetical protein